MQCRPSSESSASRKAEQVLDALDRVDALPLGQFGHQRYRGGVLGETHPRPGQLQGSSLLVRQGVQCRA